jgi:hypothetical protein
MSEAPPSSDPPHEEPSSNNNTAIDTITSTFTRWISSTPTSALDIAMRSKALIVACVLGLMYILYQTPKFIYRNGVSKPYQYMQKLTVSKTTLLARAEKEFKTHAWKLEHFDGQLIVLKRRTKEAFQQGNKELARNLALSYKKMDQRRQTFLAAYSDAYQTMSAYQAIQDMEYLSNSLKVTANIARTLDISSDRVMSLAEKIESQLSVDAKEELRDELENASNHVVGYNEEMQSLENKRNQIDELDDYILKEIIGIEEQPLTEQVAKVEKKHSKKRSVAIKVDDEEADDNIIHENLRESFMKSFELV